MMSPRKIRRLLRDVAEIKASVKPQNPNFGQLHQQIFQKDESGFGHAGWFFDDSPS